MYKFGYSLPLKRGVVTRRLQDEEGGKMGTDNQNSQEEAQNTETKLYTQEEVNAWLAKDRKKTAEKYADYDALKEKATKFDEIEEKNKSELEKANEKVKSLQAEIDGMKKAQELSDMRTKVAKENNVPIELLTGTTEDECKVQADKVKELMSASGVPVTVSDGGEVVRPGKLDPAKAFEQWAKDKL